MKAAQVTQYGGPEVLKTVSDAPKPIITDDQVLVEVHAASANPFDWKVREGMVRMMGELTFPATLGGDLAGVIAQVGANVSHVKVGDAVYGLAGALSGHGSFAEFAPVAGNSIGPKPASLDFGHAAALPMVGVSAIQALIEELNLITGQKILIHGGAGGIGSVAIQIAKHLGAYVATTTSAKNAGFVTSLGADEVIDYKTEKFQDKLSDYDAVFDTVGGDVYTDSFKVLKTGGTIVSMNVPPSEELMAEYKVIAKGFYTQVTVERLAQLTELVEAGVVTISIDKTFELDEAGEALAYLQAGGYRGKVVINVRD